MVPLSELQVMAFVESNQRAHRHRELGILRGRKEIRAEPGFQAVDEHDERQGIEAKREERTVIVEGGQRSLLIARRLVQFLYDLIANSYHWLL